MWLLVDCNEQEFKMLEIKVQYVCQIFSLFSFGKITFVMTASFYDCSPHIKHQSKVNAQCKQLYCLLKCHVFVMFLSILCLRLVHCCWESSVALEGIILWMSTLGAWHQTMNFKYTHGKNHIWFNSFEQQWYLCVIYGCAVSMVHIAVHS